MDMKSQRPNDRYVVYCVALAAIIRLGLILFISWTSPSQQRFYSGDTPSYIEPARSLLATGSFQTGGQPELSRTPGYPVFLTIGLLVGHFELVTVLLQVIVACCTTYFVYKLSLNITGEPKSAILASLFFALDPTSIIFTTLLLSETLFTFFFTVSAFLLSAYFRNHRRLTLALSALAIVAAIYTRPAAYYIPLLVLLALLYEIIATKQQRRARLYSAVVYMIVVASLLGGWQMRNYKLTGYSGFSTISDHNLYFYNAGMLLAATSNLPYAQIQTQMTEDLDRLTIQNQWQQRDIGAYKRQEAVRIISAHPIQFASVMLRGTFFTIIGSNSAEYLQALGIDTLSANTPIIDANQGILSGSYSLVLRRANVLLIYLVLQGILCFLWFTAAVGMVFAFCRQRRETSAPNYTLILLLVFIAYFLVIAGPIGYGRFRQPIMPLLCAFAGVGWLQIYARLRAKMALRSPSPSRIQGAAQKDIASQRKG